MYIVDKSLRGLLLMYEPYKVKVMGTNNKLMEATMALLQRAPEEQLNITVLNKSLFYLDLIAMRDLGRPVTGRHFVALPQGPVVLDYQDEVVKKLEKAGLAEQISAGKAKPVRVTKRLEHFELLGDDELALVESVSTKLSKMSSQGVSDLSHRNPGWELADRNGTGTAINMRIALQQVTSDDGWLAAPLDAELSQEVEKAHLANRGWE